MDDSLRVRAINQAPLQPERSFVLYWMIAARRTHWNFGLERAAAWSRELGRPLLIFEALRCGYRWASNRLHTFVIEGMRDNAANLAKRRVTYYPYVEPKHDAARGLLAELSRRSCVVVTDDFPAFFLPTMVDAVGRRLEVRLEAVDSNGLLPMRATEQVFSTAYAFRRYLQKTLPNYLPEMPLADSLAGKALPTLKAVPREILRRWPAASKKLLAASAAALTALPIDHEVKPAAFTGGSQAARKNLKQFVARRLVRYDEDRNQPAKQATTGLSPYLHFGHISAHEVFDAIMDHEEWSPNDLAARSIGKRQGWWGVSEPAEVLLDQVITWRELGYNFCSHRDDYDRYESLPDWAQKTLAKHTKDRRKHIYSLTELEGANTYDPLWNAAQRELVQEGRLHSYMRMLWGKKILEWSPTPQDALAAMIELNNKYAVDGRNPNSYSGIFWILGRYDRPWGPERPIFGKVRYMSSENTARKLDVKPYLKKFGTS